MRLTKRSDDTLYLKINLVKTHWAVVHIWWSFTVYCYLALNVYFQSIAFWSIICVTVLGLITEINLLGCGHCKKMKPEYDEAAETLNKGVDVSFITVFCFVHFSATAGDAGLRRRLINSS